MGENRKGLMDEDRNLFHLRRVICVRSIRLATFCQVGRRQHLAFVMGSGDLCLHYMSGEESSKPVMRHIPWYKDECRAISAMCFDPSANWLVAASVDGTLNIVPALALVDSAEAKDHQWSTVDVTVFPPGTTSITGGLTSSATGSPLTTHRSGGARPTAVVWWQSIMGCHHTAIVGTEAGTIIFVSLLTGVQVGITYVKDPVTELHMCHDNSLDVVFLLITCSNHNQSKLLLEQRTTGYVWPVESAVHGKSFVPSHQIQIVESDTNGKSSPRSRLQGLKQLSVEKLASIRNKLAETRSRGMAVVHHVRRESNGSSSDETTVSQQRSSTSSLASESSSSHLTTGPLPETLSAHVGETFLSPQYARGRYLLSGYHPPSSILTIHGMDIEVVPLFVHKLPPECGQIVVTDRFLFVTDSNSQKLNVISTQLSESRLDGDTDFNPDSVVSSFIFEDDERILSTFKQSVSYQKKEEKSKQGDTVTYESSKGEGQKKITKDLEKHEPIILPQKVSDLKIDSTQVDLAVIVTNRGIYEVNLRHQPVELFMEMILEHREVERAERLAMIFGLNLQQLLEMAGDLKLASKDFAQSIALYKLSRCRHLKSVLKFAVAGHSTELLGYITLLLETTGLDLTSPERIHLANLSVMAHSELILRATTGKATYLRKYLKFLSDNHDYDEVLAVSIAGQTGLWEVINFVCDERGLHFEVLETLAKIMQMSEFSNCGTVMASFNNGLWLCLSNSSLTQALICRPENATHHFNFVSKYLPYLGEEILERLATLYDPSSPVLRPAVTRLLVSRGSCSSSFSSLESVDVKGVDENQNKPLERMINVFLMVLLYLARQRNKHTVYLPELMEKLSLEKGHFPEFQDIQFKNPPVSITKNMLSAGFAHAAVIRNNTVYAWGNAAHGCLGTGPTMSRFGSPHGLSVFLYLKVEVSAVACGRQHTLLLTNNGVYAWGSSQFGQLGIGQKGQSSTPALVAGIASEFITYISAGQYHSLALTADGRVYSWGWNVHGQLGIGTIEDAFQPKLVKHLTGKIVRQVCGGHGHSVFLTKDGEVFTCGSSVFGQLGNGGNIKSSVPILVSGLPEKCILVSTGYFHNLALGASNKLYTWGSSPQVLRLQAQAHKKARLMQQQTSSVAERTSSPPGSPHTTILVSPTMEFKGLAAMGTDIGAESTNSPKHAISEETGGDKEGQHHLFPQLVDTSLVNGTIVQLSCGCHHSALLTANGTLYIWGRNLDGQLGSGSRKEVLIPTPISPPKKSPTQTLICGGIPEDTQLQQVSCGCEFTTVLERSSGRLWAWGSNTHGQLGRAPAEEGRALEGRLVMLKTSKRLIKLPQGAHNACDLPQEVTGIPSSSITYYTQAELPVFQQPCPLLNTEEPPYGMKALHLALQYFHNYYDSAAVLNKCLELENYQAAAKLALLSRVYHKALSYQLKALTLAYKTVKGNDASEENTLSIGGINLSSKTHNLPDVYHNREGKHDIAAEGETCSNVELEKSEASIGEDNKSVENNTVEELGDSNSDQISQINTSPEPGMENESSFSDHNKAHVDTFENVCVSPTPDNVLSSEMHPFAIQGGQEQMSEENRYIMSPDSLPPGLQTPDLTSSLTGDESCPSVAPDVVFTGAACDEVPLEDSSQTSKCNSSQPVSTPADVISDSSELPENDFVKEVSLIMEYYISLMEEDSHSTMSHLLQQGIDFWLQNSLPVNQLEGLLLKYMSKLFFPLGLQLFCKEDAAGCLSQLSPEFCLQLSTALLSNIEQTKTVPREYAEVLAQVVTPSLAKNSPNSGNNDEYADTDQLMETVLSSITNESLSSLRFNPSSKDVNSDHVFIFTCGHHGLKTEIDIPECPATSRALQELYGKASLPLACPHCVMGCLQDRKPLQKCD